MNQILSTNLKDFKKTLYNKRFFKVQFIFSTITIIVIIIVIILYINFLNKKQKISDEIIKNYNVYKLYAHSNEHTVQNNYNNLFGIIEIEKINIYYPIFSEMNKELLKISPCKFYGNSLEINDNICIAGHNYNNSLFFSNISLLENNDKIFIYDINGKKYTYNVFKIYEVKNSDLSPIFNYDKNSKELTLVTCNNINNNRIIVKAKQ